MSPSTSNLSSYLKMDPKALHDIASLPPDLAARANKMREAAASRPGGSQEPPFQKRVLDRLASFMLAEMKVLRDTLLSPEALIAKASASFMLQGVFGMSRNGLNKIFDPFKFLADAALGDSALRFAGHLPPAAPFAPDQPGLPCTLAFCECDGKLQRPDIMNQLESMPSPDWERVLDWLEAQQAAGRLPGPAAASGSSRLFWQCKLDSLHTQFLSTIRTILEDSNFPHLELRMLGHESTLRDFIGDIVKPLPKELAQGLASSDPREYSVDQLEALRKIGQLLREALIAMLRIAGNERWNKAASLTGKEAKDALQMAEELWSEPFMSGSLDGIAVMCNTAALALKKNDFTYAFLTAKTVIQECSNIAEEPRHYLTHRWAITKALTTGAWPHIPAADRRQMTDAQLQLRRSVHWKAHVRQGKAAEGLCRENLAGSGIMNQEKIKDARQYRDKAKECYDEAKKIDGMPAPPMKSFASLEVELQSRLKEHEDAVKAARV